MTPAPPTTLPPGLRPRESLDARERAEMFALLARHFEGVERDQFERDLAEKNWVIEIRRDGALLGFSTLLVAATAWEGRDLTVIYSGDTIVDPAAWGSPVLARTWIAAVNALRAQAPARPCYWLLLTSGFRTYRFLPVFWRTFYPRTGYTTPPDEQRLLDGLAHSHYGDHYDPRAGVVRFARPQRLRASPPPGRATDPDVAFFLARNPGHANGDELACLTRIAPDNLTPAGRRMVSTPRAAAPSP